MRGQPARGWAVAPAPRPMCSPGSVPLGSASRCPLLHPTAAAAPRGTPWHGQCHLCALNHAAAPGCTTGLCPSLCPCAQPLALVWLCKPAHLFFPCASLLPMCMPSAQVHPFSSVTSPLCVHIPSPYVHVFYLCVFSPHVHSFSLYASLLICILLPFVHPFSSSTSLFPSHFVHHFSTCASLPHMHIPSLHTHPFSLCASLLLVCIPSPHMCPFSPYVSLLLMCIPSPLVHPFSPQAPIMTISGGSAAPRAPSGPFLAAGAPCPGTPGPAGLGRGPAAPAPCLLDLACRDDGADDALGLRQSRVAMETSDVILRRRGGVRTHPSGMQPVAGVRGARTTGSP